MKIYIIRTFMLIAFFGSVISCDAGGDEEVGATNAVDFAGNWYLRLLDPNDGTDYTGYKEWATYNTSSNKDSIWVDNISHINGVQFKSKVGINKTDFTFSSKTNQANLLKPSVTVTVTGGKILKGQGKSKGKHAVDSIYMLVEYSDDPGIKYILGGHKRTGFLEDEY